MKAIRFVAAALAVSLCLAATGCGPTTAPGASAARNGESAEGATTVVLPITGNEVPADIFSQPFSVTYASPRTGGADEFVDMLMKLDAIPGCTPASKYFSADELDVQLNLAMTAGENSNPYELFKMSLRQYREHTNNGYLLQLDEYIEKYNDLYNFDDIPEASWAPAREFGNTYGIPTAVNVQHLFYREDIFEQYGLTPPRTIDDLIACCEALKDAPEIKYPIALAMDKGNGAATEFVNMMYAMDADFFDEDNNPIFNGPDGVEALGKLNTLYAYMPPAATSFTNDDTMVLMQTGEIAIMNTWASRAKYMDDETVSRVVGQVAYSHAPIYAEGKYPYANLSPEITVVPANTKYDPEQLFLVLAELTSYEAQQYYLEESLVTRLSPSEDNPEIMAEQPNISAVNETIRLGAHTGKYHPYFGSVWSIISTYAAMGIDGTMDIQEALDQAAAECVVVLQDSGYIQ